MCVCVYRVGFRRVDINDAKGLIATVEKGWLTMYWGEKAKLLKFSQGQQYVGRARAQTLRQMVSWEKRDTEV